MVWAVTLLLDPARDELYVKGRKGPYPLEEVAGIQDLIRGLRGLTEDELTQVLKKTFPSLPLSGLKCDRRGSIVELTWNEGTLMMLSRFRTDAAGAFDPCGKVWKVLRMLIEELSLETGLDGI